MAPQSKKPHTQTVNHFWPRLWSTAKPLGSEARKANCSPVTGSLMDEVDTRIFVQGGDWVLNHLDRLSAGAGTEDVESATCVLLMRGSTLFQSISPTRQYDPIQGILHSISSDKCQCEIAIHDNCSQQKAGRKFKSSVKNKSSKLVQTELTDEDIWWCIPYWVAADYQLHTEKVPVEKGFYFLVEPGQAFCIAAVNWASRDFFVRAKVDTTWCTPLSIWLLRSLDQDDGPVDFDMFESEKDDATITGQQLRFTKRETVDQPAKDWQEGLKLSGTVSVQVSETLPQVESVSTAGFTSKQTTQANAGATSSNVGACSQASDPHESARKYGAAVKNDSKWALHLSLAPTGGEERKNTRWTTANRKCGVLLGTPVLHYRASEWFQVIDLILQEERMRVDRLKENEGIVVGEAPPNGATRDTAIPIEDEPAAAPAVTGVTPQRGPVQGGGPVRNSKHFKVSFHEDGRGSPVSHTFPVPKTRSVSVYKDSVKDVLAEEDFYGEDIRTTRLKWTYLDGDGCEMDITPLTEASELETSAALHVYTLPKRS